MLILIDPLKTLLINSDPKTLLVSMLPETNSFSNDTKNKSGMDCWVNKFLSLLFQAAACNLACKLVNLI